jgi:hypothetical protein
MSPPNCTPESAYVRQVKHLIETHLTTAERARLRPWLLAHFDVQGYGRARVEETARPGDVLGTATD